MLWKVTVGLASHWPCGTDFSGLSTHGLTAKVREMSTAPMPFGHNPLYLYLQYDVMRTPDVIGHVTIQSSICDFL